MKNMMDYEEMKEYEVHKGMREHEGI